MWFKWILIFWLVVGWVEYVKKSIPEIKTAMLNLAWNSDLIKVSDNFI